MANKVDEYMKAAILLSIRMGTTSRAAASKRYMVSENELALWELAFDEDGTIGLRDRRLSARRRGTESLRGETSWVD